MIYRLLLTACSLPLVIYPGILMAGIMGLSSPPSPDATPLKILVAKGFLWSSILYPVGYAAGVAVSVRSAAAGAAIAGGHLFACLALFGAWYLLSAAR